MDVIGLYVRGPGLSDDRLIRARNKLQGPRGRRGQGSGVRVPLPTEKKFIPDVAPEGQQKSLPTVSKVAFVCHPAPPLSPPPSVSAVSNMMPKA